MDEREFEARLRAHLHRRLDDAAPSRELSASVEQVFRTAPSGVDVRDRRFSARLSWSMVGVAALAAIVVAAAVRLNGVIGPGDPGSARPSAPSPSIWIASGRPFVVVPPFGSLPTPRDTAQAADVLRTRLDVLGVQGIEVSVRSGIEFWLPEDGPSDASIRSVLSTSDDVWFVPLPQSYRDGTHDAEVGEPLPTDEEPLFGWDGIDQVGRVLDQQNRPVISISLNAAAAATFAQFTGAHIGETFAILLGDRVVLLPAINEPISDGLLQVSGGGDDQQPFDETMAILVAGQLPSTWEPVGNGELDAPQVMPAATLVEQVSQEFPRASVTSMELDAVLSRGRWVGVWRLTLEGELPVDCPAATSPSASCTTTGSRTLVVDASNGGSLD